MERDGHIWDDWADPTEHEKVLRALFADVGRSSVEVVQRADAAHFREMSLEWRDGHKLVLRLDQGLTFLKAIGYVQHRFGDAPAAQARAIRDTAFSVRRSTGAVVPLYLQGPLAL